MKIDPYHVIKQAGTFHAVAESLNDSLALARANSGGKLSGKNNDSPADALVARSPKPLG